MLYLKSLEIENVRCFGKKQLIDFSGKDGNVSQWTVILGDNGTGKTSVLRSIVSMLPSPQSFIGKRSQIDTEYNLSINNEWRNVWDLKHKEGEKDSILNLKVIECVKAFINETELEWSLTHKVSHNRSNPEDSYLKPTMFDTKVLSPVYCFAYGANRKMAEKSLSNESFTNTSETLYKDDALLQNSSEYFLRIDYETAKSKKGNADKNRVKDLLLKVLPKGVKDIDVFKSGRLLREVRVDTEFGWVSLNDLSLGYKTTIAWLIDFATKMMYYNYNSDNPFEEPAILILDEIDLHMHPAWQRDIIKNLTNLFPKTQFIVTAHSPLIAQAAIESNLILLKRSGDHISVINDPHLVKSWRIDQVLTSDLFGLKGTRNANMEVVFKERRKLLLKDKLNENDERKLKNLESKIEEIPIAETQEYIKAMEILLKASKHTSL